MNLQKKYEEYQAGTFSAHNFLREARMAYPNFVSNLNGIDDAVKILKNNNLIFEAKKEEVYAPAPIDVLESAIRFELGEMGCDIYSCTSEEYIKARDKAEKNLAKDTAFYANLKAGVKKDDTDKMKPATSQNMVDGDNNMKVVKLQEAIFTVILKRMLTEEVNESVVVTLPMTPAGYTRGEIYDTEKHGKVKIIDQITNNGDGYEDFKVEKL